jgi:hypothetical protein
MADMAVNDSERRQEAKCFIKKKVKGFVVANPVKANFDFYLTKRKNK